MDHAFVLLGGEAAGKEMTLVQASRAKSFTSIYVNVTETGTDLDKLAERLSAATVKDLASDRKPPAAKPVAAEPISVTPAVADPPAFTEPVVTKAAVQTAESMRPDPAGPITPEKPEPSAPQKVTAETVPAIDRPAATYGSPNTAAETPAIESRQEPPETRIRKLTEAEREPTRTINSRDAASVHEAATSKPLRYEESPAKTPDYVPGWHHPSQHPLANTSFPTGAQMLRSEAPVNEPKPSVGDIAAAKKLQDDERIAGTTQEPGQRPISPVSAVTASGNEGGGHVAAGTSEGAEQHANASPEQVSDEALRSQEIDQLLTACENALEDDVTRERFEEWSEKLGDLARRLQAEAEIRKEQPGGPRL